MKMTHLAPVFGAALVAGLSSAGGAGAVTSETFNLNVQSCGVGCFVPATVSVGSVTVKDISGALEFSVDLADAWFNVAGKGDPQVLGFSIERTGIVDSLAGLNIQVSTPGFAGKTAASVEDAPLGAFQDSINFLGTVKGYGGAVSPSSLSFVVTDKDNNLSLANISPGMMSTMGAIYMAANLFANNARPGTFAALGDPPSLNTPEPGSWALMLIGIGFIGAVLRRPRALHRPHISH